MHTGFEFQYNDYIPWIVIDVSFRAWSAPDVVIEAFSDS